MRVRVTAVSMALLLPLALAACGGSSSNAIRDEAVAEMTKQMTDSGASQTQIDCAVNVVKSLSDDDVNALDSDTASTEVEDKFFADIMACGTAP